MPLPLPSTPETAFLTQRLQSVSCVTLGQEEAHLGHHHVLILGECLERILETPPRTLPILLQREGSNKSTIKRGPQIGPHPSRAHTLAHRGTPARQRMDTKPQRWIHVIATNTHHKGPLPGKTGTTGWADKTRDWEQDDTDHIHAGEYRIHNNGLMKSRGHLPARL